MENPDLSTMEIEFLVSVLRATQSFARKYHIHIVNSFNTKNILHKN